LTWAQEMGENGEYQYAGTKGLWKGRLRNPVSRAEEEKGRTQGDSTRANCYCKKRAGTIAVY